MPSAAVMVVLLCGSPQAADGACLKENVQNGVDRSLPCRLRSPLPSGLDRVGFEQGSHALDGRSQAILDRQAEILRAYPSILVTVYGHVDHREAAEAGGRALGYNRALAVRDYLIRRGVLPERISTDSRGDRWALPMTASEEALSAMRFASTEVAD